MKDRLSLLDYLTVAVFAVQAGFALHVGLNGPTERVLPIHWNAAFEIDGWASGKEFAVLLGGMAVIGLISGGGMGLYAMRASIAGESPRARTLRIGQGVIAFTVAILGLTISAQTFGDLPPEGTARLSMAGLSLILLGTGAFLGRVAPNRLVGVRTPWSYKSRLAWDRSNRLAGRLLFLLGLIGLFTAPWTPQPAGTLSQIAAALVAAALSTFESWRVWRADPNRRPL